MIIMTGASGGIGASIISSLAKLDDIIAIYNNKPLIIENVENIDWIKVDLSSEREIKSFYNSIKGKITKITLIHAAAITKDKLAWQLDSADWRDVLDVNLNGNFLLTKELIIPMIKESWGRIIHFSSITASRGSIGTLAYSASKSGILGMSKVLAHEYGRFGITSNVITPGYLDTGLINLLDENAKAKILSEIPIGKFGDPGNVVNAIDFLMRSEYVNGSSININGGID
ncbi:SDR family NAD(P)-dependent oxidoreductase [Paracoccaceae bacterium]|nr:SDR family NAD(P)-dependent oxidoreductase [Paracoccaceae bacterium]